MLPPKNVVSVQNVTTVDADQLNTYTQWVANATQLRDFPGAYEMLVFSEGYTEPGDGGQGYYYWAGLSQLADDGKNVIQPCGYFFGRWIRLSGVNVSISCGTCNLSPNPIVQLDFCRNAYSVNGTLLPLASMIDKPGLVSNGALQLSTIGHAPNDDTVSLIGSALAAVTPNPLLTQLTFVIDWFEVNTDPTKAATLFTIQSADQTSEFQILRAASPRYVTSTVLAPVGGSNVASSSPAVAAAGRHRIAVTITNNEDTLSLDGGTNVVGGSNMLLSFNAAYALFGGIRGGNLTCPVNIVSLYVYNSRAL